MSQVTAQTSSTQFCTNKQTSTRKGKARHTNALKWHPPVDLSHLRDNEQEIVRQLLHNESDVFAKDDADIGCIPNLQLKIHQKD